MGMAYSIMRNEPQSEKHFKKIIPGCEGQAHTIIAGGGHFIQEDKGEELATIVNTFIAANPFWLRPISN